jgi:hypothetical protein
MHPTESPATQDRSRIAQQRRAARARRIATLRRRVVAGAPATVVPAWGVVSQAMSCAPVATAQS